MDRRQWLTMVYREANRFLESRGDLKADTAIDQLDELDPLLRDQLQAALKGADYLEDIIKFSLLKDPLPTLWKKETSWERVLIAVATECLVHDVRGVILKILAGELPRAPSGGIRESE